MTIDSELLRMYLSGRFEDEVEILEVQKWARILFVKIKVRGKRMQRFVSYSIVGGKPQETIVVWFSCGAASAVAAKLAIDRYGFSRVRVCNNPIQEEDGDNRRFLKDVEKWIGKKIENPKGKEDPCDWVVTLGKKVQKYHIPILIEEGLTKRDYLQIILDAGIELPSRRGYGVV